MSARHRRHLRLSFDVRVGQLQAGAGVAAAEVRFYKGPDCTLGTVAGGVFRAAATTGGAWQHVAVPAVAVPPGTGSVYVLVGTVLSSGSGFAAAFDNLSFGTPCQATGTTLCLNHDRFAVTASWNSGQAQGVATAVALTSDSGYFTFFDPSNVEIVVKVLDGCGLDQRYWVFAAGLTDVAVDLTVTDTLFGAARVYSNPLHRAYPPLQDTSAIATCP